MVIQSNIPSLRASNNLQKINKQKKKAIANLSSGYQINKAADNAAGLSISEGMRAQIRGLERAIRNAEEGISYVQVVDGAMEQVSNILQRIRELSIQSLNDTNTQEDRFQIQKEIEQLRKEIDGLNRRTEFNSKKVFDHYKGTYYSYNGGHAWELSQMHSIDGSNDSLTITYSTKDGGEQQELEITLEHGNYTTEELFEEIDKFLETADPSVSFELRYNTDKTCAIEMRDGNKIEQVSGGLSYLFSGGYNGAETAFLVGTTVFHPGYPLTIVEGRNDVLSFDIENYDDTVEHIDIKIKAGKYTREEMIDLLNQHLKGTGMAASNYGDYSIQIGGNNGMISGLKGNMFQIDEKGSIVVSVFYDNTKYGTAEKVPAVMKGGAVLLKSDPIHNKYHINASNDKLYIKTGNTSTGSYQEITLSHGDYTIDQMVQQLQSKMNHLGVTVQSYSEPYLTPNGKNEICFGLEIATNIKGETASLEFDITKSTAYNTLFVERFYDDQNMNQDLGFLITNDQDYRYPLYNNTYGYASFPKDKGPYKIDSSNNSFQIQIKEAIPDVSAGLISKESEFTITLTEKNYNDINEIIDEINLQIEKNTGLKGKIKAFSGSVDNISNIIQLRNANRDVCKIHVSPNGNNLGYKTLFSGEIIKTIRQHYYSGISQAPKLTLPENFFNNVTVSDIKNDTIKIDSSNNTFGVSAGGYPEQQIQLKEGIYTRKQLEEAITKKLQETRTEEVNGFYQYGAGKGPSVNSYYGYGKENTLPVSCNVQGQGKKQDGSTFVENGKPAEFLMNTVPLDNEIKIDSGNDTFELEISGVPCEIKLSKGSYSPQKLADALNTALLGKIKVTLEGKYLKFTSVEMGEGATIAFGNDGNLKNSSFLEGLCTKKEPASCTTSNLQSNIHVTASENTFQFSLNGTNVSITLPSKDYSRSEFVAELNNQFQRKNIDVTAELIGSQLRLTTKEVGSNMRLTVIPDKSGSLSEAMFGKKEEASVKITQPLLNSITIPANNNEFQISVRGATGNLNTYKAVLTPGKTYSAEELVQELNKQFSNIATITLDKDGLTFKTKDKGSNTYMKVSSNDNNKELIKAMFGSTKAPELTASFSNQNLEIIGSQQNNSYQIEAWNNKMEQEEKAEPKEEETTRTIGYYSLKTQNALSSKIAITEENKDLSFSYSMPNGIKNVQFSLPEKVYTREELQRAIQEEIDKCLGAGELGISIDEQGILFQALKCGPGNDKISYSGYNNYHYILQNSFSGGFFNYIIEGNIARKEYLTPSLEQGGIKLSDTYIIGRRDVKNTITHIMEGETDRLKIDITFTKEENGKKEEKVFTLDMVLDDGNYSYKELIAHVQSKLDEAVLTAGLPAHSVLVDVGLFDSGVVGANDGNAIQFYLNPELKWEEGEYKIDGIAGNSLPAVFYSTTGDPIPAYITGTKDISSGVKITPGNNEFSIKVDGIVYEYEIPEGDYSEEAFLAKMNELFRKSDKNGNTAMIKAGSQNGHFKVSYRGQGIHYLSSVQGSSRSTVFFKDTMIKQHSSLRLQVGANSGQEMEIQRTSVGSFRLGIDTVSVETRTLAKKALKHVDKAMKYVSGERAIYGAYQNRLEHIVNANSIASENLQDAESRIRDADIADEMVGYAKCNILEQAGTAMLANANTMTEHILLLLRA